MKNKCFLVIGPSGSGKTVLVNGITNNRAITSTTRKIREGEVNGEDYFFLTKESFEDKIKNGEFIEWAKYGREGKEQYYGLTWEEFNKRIEVGDLFIVCDIQGVQHYKKNYSEALVIFIYSDFGSTQQQLIDRGGNKSDIEERIALYKDEMKWHELADMVVKNKYGQLDESLKNFKNIIQELKMRG